MEKIKIKINSISLYIILAAALILLSAPAFSSCGNAEKNRTAFSPVSGAYEIMLNPDEWSVVTLQEDKYDQLGLFNAQANIILLIDCYTKPNLSDLGVSSLDGFIEFYKTFDNIKAIYESEDNTGAGGLTDVAKKDIKGSSVARGKRQKFYMRQGETEIIQEIIHLETENCFIAVLYAVFPENFDESQKAVNDAVAHIKTVE